MRPTKGVSVTYGYRSLVTNFVAALSLVSQFVAFSQSVAVVCRSFLDSLSPLFKECHLSVITPWWASYVRVYKML